MIKAFILVVAIFTNEGELQMKAVPVEKCPDAAGFTQAMDKMKNDKRFLDWNAICIPPQTDA